MRAERRQFLKSCLGDTDAPEAHVASLLLQVLPSARDRICAELDARPRCSTTVAGSKVVLVAEFQDEGALTELMGEIAELPGVLSVSLVYHQVETSEALNEEIANADDPS